MGQTWIGEDPPSTTPHLRFLVVGEGPLKGVPTFQVSQTFRTLGIYDIPHLNFISRTGWGSPHSPFTSSQGCDVSALLRLGLDLHTGRGTFMSPRGISAWGAYTEVQRTQAMSGPHLRLLS